MMDGLLMLEAVQKTKPMTKAIQARRKKSQPNNKSQNKQKATWVHVWYFMLTALNGRSFPYTFGESFY